MDVLISVIFAILGRGEIGLFSMLTGALTAAGLWGVFRKCGVKGWWALVPCFNRVRIGEISDRENEGRISAVTSAVIFLLETVQLLIQRFAASEAADRSSRSTAGPSPRESCSATRRRSSPRPWTLPPSDTAEEARHPSIARTPCPVCGEN